jgi:hypothetical protein
MTSKLFQGTAINTMITKRIPEKTPGFVITPSLYSEDKHMHYVTGHYRVAIATKYPDPF